MVSYSSQGGLKLNLFFADDTKRRNPRRSGMGPLVGVGGILVAGDQVGRLERAIQNICKDVGFPHSLEPFKWSPRRNQWMYNNLVGDNRTNFFNRVLQGAIDAGAKAIVVLEDKNYNTAMGGTDHEFDALALVIERLDNLLVRRNAEAAIVIAEPSGGRAQEKELLRRSHNLLQEGTEYVNMERISISALTSPFNMIRCLQLADLVVSSTSAVVAGDDEFASQVFTKIKRLFPRTHDTIGGRGIKLHPDIKYLNLYHWLFDDTHYWRFNQGYPLPFERRPYFNGPNER